MTEVIEIMSSPRAVEPMVDSVNAQNTTPTLKRKADSPEAAPSKQKGRKPTPDKRAKQPAGKKPLIKLQGRKLVFNQQTPYPAAVAEVASRALAWSLYHTQRIQTATASGDSLGKQWNIPDDLLDVAAYHGHEKREKTVALLAKRISKDMASVPGFEVSTEWLSRKIPELFDQREYGVMPSDAGSNKVPASLQLKVWELKDLPRWLSGPHYPAEMVRDLETRRQEREQARAEIVEAIRGMDDVERLELLRGEGVSKTGKVAGTPEADGASEPEEELEAPAPAPSGLRKSLIEGERGRRESTVASTSSRRSLSPTKKSKLTPEELEERQRKRDEKQAKAAQKAEERAVKDAEVAKKEAAVAKQAQAMSMFFKQKSAATPAPVAVRPAVPSSLPAPAPLSTSPSPAPQRDPSNSDYRRTFRGVSKKANVEWADVNIWRRRLQQESGAEAGSSKQAIMDHWTPRDFLVDHLKNPHKTSRRRLHTGLKTVPLYGSIADAWISYQEADDPRRILDRMKSRRRFPWKTLAFDHQTRPPYCGTFTKKSASVGPRTPFAQDPMFDYSYDSGDDWQEEEPGEDVDGPGEAVEVEDEEDEDESEGEFDDWLDDAEEEAGSVPAADNEDPLVQDTLKLPCVKKARDAPVKRVVKVTPFWRGPMWEKSFGEGSDAMESFRIQLLNDAPSSLDPFFFSSPEPVQVFKPTYTSIAIGTNLTVRCLTASNPVSVDLVAETDSVSRTTAPDSSAPEDPGKPAPAYRNPKNTFPTALLPELYGAIEGNSDIRTDLVSKLRAQFEGRATKGAIEQKLKEVGEREGKVKGSLWRVKDEAWISAGLQVPKREVIVKEDRKAKSGKEDMDKGQQTLDSMSSKADSSSLDRKPTDV